MGTFQSIVTSRLSRGGLKHERRTGASRTGSQAELLSDGTSACNAKVRDSDTSRVTLRHFLTPASHRSDEALYLLTRILSYAAGDAAPQIAKTLMEDAATLPRALVTPGHRIRSMTGDEKVAEYLDLLVKSFNHTVQVGLRTPNLHPTAEQLQVFLLSRLGLERVEVLYVLFFSANGSLIYERELARGNKSACLPCPREIARIALSVGADAVVLGHNHPSGSVQPSREDVQFSAQVAASLSLADAVLLDHLIVANGATQSMRQLGLLPRIISDRGAAL